MSDQSGQDPRFAIVHVPRIEILAWERMAIEPDDAWAAFRLYRDMMPPRRQRAVSGYATEKISRWYNEYRWIDRADSYDRYMEKARIAERVAILKQTEAERVAADLAMLNTSREFAQRELDKLLAASRENDGIGLTKVSELSKLVDTIIRNGRLIHGQSTENVDHKVDYSNLTIDELRTLHQLRKKAQKE